MLTGSITGVSVSLSLNVISCSIIYVMSRFLLIFIFLKCFSFWITQFRVVKVITRTSTQATPPPPPPTLKYIERWKRSWDEALIIVTTHTERAKRMRWRNQIEKSVCNEKVTLQSGRVRVELNQAVKIVNYFQIKNLILGLVLIWKRGWTMRV